MLHHFAPNFLRMMKQGKYFAVQKCVKKALMTMSYLPSLWISQRLGINELSEINKIHIKCIWKFLYVKYQLASIAS